MLKQSIELRLAAFYQTLSGISALHHAGLIHRDIKPANLGVVHLDKDKDQISTVILDYGQTISATSCDPKPGAVGTVPYLAPEMESKPYGPGVDIWACAIVGIQLFITEGKVKWRRVEQEKVQYEIMLKALQALPSNTIYNLLSQMLSYEPGQRISASSALRHPCFAKVNATEALAEI
jgi:serine/threonine protein kinase